MNVIPTVDISALVCDADESARKAATNQLTAALRPHGCAAIIGHGMTDNELQEAFTVIRTFFDLSAQDKAKAKHPDTLLPHRGYLATSIQRSDSKGSSPKSVQDYKESYDIGHEDNKTQKNIWLPDDVLPGFRQDMVTVFRRLNAISLAILEGLVSGMGLSESDCETMRQIHTPIEHQMRLAHYLPLEPEDRQDPNSFRLAPHTDFASYTLLLQESDAGLEFQNRDTGEYMPATPKQGVLYLNIGDIMERYSNGFYPSSMHRVSIPLTGDSSAMIPGRYTIPYFTHIALDQLIYPMPSRVQIDGESKYEPIESRVLMGKLFKSKIGKTKA